MSPKFDPSQPYTIVKEGKKQIAKFDPSKEYKILSGEEVSPREDQSEIPGLEFQKEIAEGTKDLAAMYGHGVSQGFSDEALAGIETGSLSSPEYVTRRDQLRSEMQKRKEEYPIAGSLAEAAGSVTATTATPFMRSVPIVKEMLSSGLSGVGEARSMEEAPREAAKSMILQGAAEVGGKVLKNTLFDDPTKILTRSVGVQSRDIKGDVGAKAIQATDRLNAAGFFKQGEVSIAPQAYKFKRSAKDLTGFLKPLTDDDLYKRATDNISILKSRNQELLKGKKIPRIEFQKAMHEGITDLTYDPKGFNVEARWGLAEELRNIVEKDLKYKGGYSSRDSIDAQDIELAKQSLDAHIKGPAFEKKLLDLGIDKQGMMQFRTKLDDLLDSHKVGGVEYKKNNELMSDLITLSEIIEAKEATTYVDTGTRLINNQNWWEKAKDAISPTYVDIMRSDIAKIPESKAGSFATKTLTRTPTERYTGRQPQSIGFAPREIINYRVPLSTQAVLEQKDKVLAKFVQKGLPEEMIETLTMALNGDPGDLSDILPMILIQMPEIFEKSKYKVFDGKFIDPNDKARAADSISRREDINSIQRAKMISKINKNGEVPEGMV